LWQFPLELIFLVAVVISTAYESVFVNGFSVAPALSSSSSFRHTSVSLSSSARRHPDQSTRRTLFTSGATLDKASRIRMTVRLFAAKAANLRPASAHLMEAGKQLAVAGEQLIAWTDLANLYGGGISAAGAQLRNAGDSVAQAAASCRFQTGQELVCDELRTSADCLAEASNKLELGVEEANVDGQRDLQTIIQGCVPLVQRTSYILEKAGAGIMQNRPIPDIARCLADAGQCLVDMSAVVGQLGTVTSRKAPGKARGDNVDVKNKDASAIAGDAARRMLLAGENMVEAGRALVPRVPSPESKAVGKRWIKGGGGGGGGGGG
jgi:hypothetical protein